jgi:hypothetical protein
VWGVSSAAVVRALASPACDNEPTPGSQAGAEQREEQQREDIERRILASVDLVAVQGAVAEVADRVCPVEESRRVRQQRDRAGP